MELSTRDVQEMLLHRDRRPEERRRSHIWLELLSYYGNGLKLFTSYHEPSASTSSALTSVFSSNHLVILLNVSLPSFALGLIDSGYSWLKGNTANRCKVGMLRMLSPYQ